MAGDGLESPVQTAGEFATAFGEPGTLAYRCTLHFLMHGNVVVTGAGGASSIINPVQLSRPGRAGRGGWRS